MINKINPNGHNPLPLHVRIGQSSLHGMGIFAVDNLEAGHDFGITHVLDDRFEDNYIRTPFGAFINHSNAPNCTIFEQGDTLHIKTKRAVRAGEELTMDYRPYYPDNLVATFK